MIACYNRCTHQPLKEPHEPAYHTIPDWAHTGPRPGAYTKETGE